MEKKIEYKNIEGKKLEDMSSDEKKSFSLVVKIDKNTTLDKLEEKLNEKKREQAEKHLWILWGKKDNIWECLQVGATTNNIITQEIKPNIRLMYQVESDKEEGEKTLCDTQFYEKVYSVPKEIDSKNTRRQYRYRQMFNDYNELAFYSIDIDKYLELNNEKISRYPQAIQDMISISKMNYAEAKIAYETQAIYWNAYKSGIDMKALMLLVANNSKLE